MDSQLEEIKNKLSVVDVVGGYIKLTKTGINYRGVCPFHSEKKPSFFVSPHRQMWHCFGCGAGSSIFDFVMKIEGVEFGDALRILAAKAGIQLKQENPRLRTERARLYEICHLACSFFEKQLESSQIGQEAKKYLLGRGITQDSINRWRLGYSPDTWNGLSDFLVGKGYQRSEIVKAGLAIEKEGKAGDSYDRFRGRIMFPVFDVNSQVVGFGGRVFKEADNKEIAKYINTPQTMLYDKSSLLYGLNYAKLAVRKQNQCVVTEGYTDVIMCHQAGYENTVAASGTALTSQHLTILKRYTENLVLAFDMDVAGDSATKRGIDRAQEQGFNIKIVESYVTDADPAEIILKDPEIWPKAVANARSIMDYYFDSAFASYDKKTPEGKKNIGRIILPVIRRLQNTIEQSYWVQKLAEMLSIKEEAVLAELAKLPSAPAKDAAPHSFETALEPHAAPEQRKKLLEEKIIALVLKNPEHIYCIQDNQYEFFSEKVASFLLQLKKIIIEYKPDSSETAEKNFQAMFATIAAGEGQSEFHIDLKNFLAALALSADVEYIEDGKEEVELCLVHLKNIALREKLNRISRDLKVAEANNNHEQVTLLIEQFNTLTKEL